MASKNDAAHLIQNPIIPGFYPDPSICRVGEDYYLANSSFELYPGIPIFHSRDLAHWEQISYAMTKENGFHVGANILSGGVMAPTLRYHDGLFYLINQNVGDRGNYIVTAKDPRGPWSEPHWLEDMPDIDCSLFFDDDGSAYLVSPGDDPSEDNGRAFFLIPFDVHTFQARGPKKKIWNSALRRAWAPEAPHLYHIGDYYYLMTAEGGTEHNHAVCIARSRTVDGVYEGNPANPVLTHRHLGWEYPIENIGHADLVETPSGKWYAVCLGVRIIEGQHMNLGRETFLCPVVWQRGWPVFAPETGRVESRYPADPDLPWEEVPGEKERDDFNTQNLDLCWSFWGTPYQDFWDISDGCLTLKCLARPLDRALTSLAECRNDHKNDNVSFLGRRQRSINGTFTVKMRFVPKEKEAAGLVVMQACNHQFRLEKRQKEGGAVLALVKVTTWQKGFPFLPDYESRTSVETLCEEPAPEGDLILRFVYRGEDFRFYAGTDEDSLICFGPQVDGRDINPEEVGGMVGTMLGVFATGNGKTSDNRAYFDWIEYIQD